jgi:tricorn protease
MRTNPSMILALSALCLAPLAAQDEAVERTIRMARELALSPDGGTLVFAWQGDLWRAASTGGDAVRLTTHPADDGRPAFSPDGRTIAFHSSRAGRTQIFTVPIEGGAPRQVTSDSEGKSLLGWTPDGAGLILLQGSDRGAFGTESQRVFRLELDGSAPRRMLLDVGLRDAALSPCGTKLAFTRGRASWTRKGYRGSAAEQLWLADLGASPVTIERLDADRPDFMNVSHLWPMFGPRGESLYYVSDPDGTFDLYRRHLADGTVTRITEVGKADGSDDGLVHPALSADGSTLVFRRRFDLQRLDLRSGAIEALQLRATGDRIASAIERQQVTSATEVAFTQDGKQIAFVAGHDVYVMDRILREPRRLTDTPHREDNLAFTQDGRHLYFTSDADGEVDLWRATLTGEDGIWWIEERGPVAIERITADAEVESRLRISPTGKHFAYVRGTELWVMDADGTDHRRVVATWSTPDFDWSPDGRWLCYATSDDDYNSDIYLVPLDGTRPPYNLSRHPDNEGDPVWSPDGSRIAFAGRRDGEESDVYVVTLTRSVEEATDRDRRLKEALDAMKKGKAKGGDPAADPRDAGQAADKPASEAADESTVTVATEGFGDPKAVRIDFDGIHERIARIAVPNSFETGLVWSPDGKKLAFSATVDGVRGVYTVDFPKPGRPAKWVDAIPSGGRWLKEGNQIVGAVGGVPAALDSKGKTARFEFSVRRLLDWRELRRIAFDQGWRAMRDRFYDPALNNRDWEAVRAKYREAAAQCLGQSEFSELMNMMLGELNASHMGHSGGGDPLPAFRPADGWSPTTWHLGVRFALADAGPGLLVESVIPGSPAALARSRIDAGERVLAIDGVEVGPATDLLALMTRDEAEELEVLVQGREGQRRAVSIRPVASVRGLLYEEWVERTRRAVEELSGGKLGYLHIAGMNMPSFRQMEEDIHFAGHGKDGLIIDVRFNGGGSTTDHVLTALTQPRHAITVSRGSGEGYPQDRKVYASWHKPIVLMCNEHSFSNAEILAHAIRTLGRGPVVGMRTAGGVISTGGATLLDGSSVRMPTRGWYLLGSGKDMELNGAMPDVALWNDPRGGDAQLEAAVRTLAAEVEAAAARPDPEPVPAATERRGR